MTSLVKYKAHTVSKLILPLSSLIYYTDGESFSPFSVIFFVSDTQNASRRYKRKLNKFSWMILQWITTKWNQSKYRRCLSFAMSNSSYFFLNELRGVSLKRSKFKKLIQRKRQEKQSWMGGAAVTIDAQI